MYNMWSQGLLSYLKLIQYGIDLRDFKTEELENIVRRAFEEVLLEEAWKLCSLHNLSLGEARYIILKQLINEAIK